MKTIDLKNTISEKIIAQTIEVLNAGGLIIFPTETTYGAAVDATNSKAVEKLLSYKSRREGKPLSIAVSNKKMASEYVFINKQADKIFQQFLPGPVTVVCSVLEKQTTKDSVPNSQKQHILAPGVASEFSTLGIRIPDYQLILDLITSLNKPITATSANGSGKKRPYKIDDILQNLSKKQKGLIDLVLDAGELPHNEPSTVIDTTLSAPVVLRNGDLKSKFENSRNNENRTGKNKNSSSLIELVSSSEEETKSIAGRFLLKNWDEVSKNGLIIGLDGSLGTGKTIFTKGIAKFLNIKETIKSPTYSYIEEYEFKRHQTTGKLFHLDMWKVEDKNMFDRLEIDALIGKNNIVVVEWFDQISEFLGTQIKNTATLRILIEQDGENRKISIHN